MKKFMKTQVGRFTAALIALLIVIGVAVGAQQLPFLRADVTMQKLMSMSEASQEIAKGIGKDVVISYLATEGSKELWVEELAKKYASANGRITYQMVSPTGAEALRLAALCGKTPTENSLVVSSDERACMIASDEMYSLVYDQMMFYYYGEYVVSEQYFVADEQIANALLYVTRDDLPVIYALSGHGETAAGSYILDELRMKNIVLRTLNLTDEVPADAAAVMVFAPTADLNDQETKALRNYLKNGGDLILMTGYMMEKMPNLNMITSYYGMEQIPGVVLDSAAGYCYSAEYPQYLMPDLADHATTEILAGSGVKPTISLAGALKKSSIARGGLTVTELMTTSDQSYMKTSPAATSLAMEDGDPMGPFVVAMAAEEGDTHIVWYGSGTFLTDNEVAVSSGYNIFLLDDTLSWMTPTVERVEIEGGDLMASRMNIPEGQTNVSMILMFVPALVALAVGLIMKKKK